MKCSAAAKAPPIKIQGIKTKLVPFILSNVEWPGRGRWVEPFLGSGAVLFNVQPKKALVADTNRHIVRVYQAIQAGELTPDTIASYLAREGETLKRRGEEHYYAVRARFNCDGSPFDFLFLNRACFNGIVRFNLKGGFNVPFCKKPNRFDSAMITKIANQVGWAAQIMAGKEWTFVAQDWRQTLSMVRPDDFVYIDPPYVGRHTDYFNQWDETEADDLANAVKKLSCGFAYSMWSKNKYRENSHLKTHFTDYTIAKSEHFYHVGSRGELRNSMEEALVTNRPVSEAAFSAPQLSFL